MNAERAMRQALAQARRASGRSWPNPPVGAVLLRGEQVLARGATREAGGAHAEIVALERARRRHGARALRGATLVVTLEPCVHQGRTGPCTRAIIEAGVRRVFAGHRDPNPHVRGRGLAALRRAGVEVHCGILEEACRWQHRGFLSWVERGRPQVALKLAATLDGRIATRAGESRWITGPEARAQVHRLRAEVDAVMVGSLTARADAPALTARRGERVVRAPIRVVVDGRLRVPAASPLFRDAFAERTWLLTRRGHSPGALARRQLAGAQRIELAASGEHLPLGRALRTLATRGLTSILVEGGGGLAAALLRAGLVDEVHWFAAPTLLGSEGRPALGPLGVGPLAGAPQIEPRRVRRIGRDLYLHGMVVRREGRG